MNLTRYICQFNIKSKDILYVLLILIFSLIIFSIKFNFYLKIGVPNSDTIIYLCDALYFAGMNPNNIGGLGFIFNSPVICFFTSLFYRFGFSSPNSIMIVTSIFEILGNIGLYILLKNKFDSLLSFTGTIFYSSTALVIYYSTMGMLDIAAVSVSIWILIFTILAVNSNYKFYLIAFPLLSIGIFVRPTVGFVFPLILLIIINKYDILKLFDNLISDKQEFKISMISFLKSVEFKYFIYSVIISFLIVFFIVTVISYIFNVPYPLFNTVKDSMSSFQGHQSWDFYYNTDYLFYINLIPKFIILEKFHYLYKIVYLIFMVVIFGFCLKGVNFIKNRNDFKKNLNPDYYKTSNYESWLKIIMLILVIISIFGFKKNYMISDVSLFIVFMITLSLLKKYKNLDSSHIFTILNLAGLLFYLLFISYINFKVDRYFIPVLIPITYFIIYFIDYLVTSTDNFFEIFDNFNMGRITFSKVCIFILVLILMFNAFHMIDDSIENTSSDTYNVFLKNTYWGSYYDLKNVSDYLIEYDNDYHLKNISTDTLNRFYDWFLNKPTNSINLNFEEISTFDSCGSEYIILEKDYEFENYTEIYSNRNSHLYKLNHS